MNNSTSECDLIEVELVEFYVFTAFNRIFMIVLVPIITAVGVFTNGMFLFMLYHVREMRTVTNFFLANLAVADGCLLLGSSSQWIASYSNSPLDAGMAFSTPLGCALPNFFVYVFYFASIFLVSVVIVERYGAICHPMVYRSSLADRHQRVVASAIWVISLAFSGFSLTHSKAQRFCVQWPSSRKEFAGYPEVLWICDHNEDLCSKLIVVMIDLCQFCICVSIVSFMSVSISLCLIRGELHSRQSRMRSSSTMRARLYLARMVMINAMVFFVCLTPFEIVNFEQIIAHFVGTDMVVLPIDVRRYLARIGRVTMIINSAINPIIYSAVHPRYRDAAWKAFRCPGSLRAKRGRPMVQGGTSSGHVDKISDKNQPNMTLEIITNLTCEIELDTKSQRSFCMDQNGKCCHSRQCPLATFSDL